MDRNFFRSIAALVAGAAVGAAIGLSGFKAFGAFWPAYAAAIPDWSFTLPMLFARLALGITSTALAACTAVSIAPDNRRIEYWLAALFVAIFIPDHLYPGYSWGHLPNWYQFAALGYHFPAAILAARFYRATGADQKMQACLGTVGT